MKSFLRQLGSMSFAVFLLLLLAIASIAGTVIAQNAPLHDYLRLFGPIGLRIIDLLTLDHLYNAWWFLGILFFLVLSTGTCLCRRIPLLIRLHLLSPAQKKQLVWTHQTTWPYPLCTEKIARIFNQSGHRYHIQQPDPHCLLVERGRHWHSGGYILTHLAILIILLGGVLDSEALLHLWAWHHHKHPTQANTAHSENTFWPNTLRSFTGYVFLSPGKTNDRATLYLQHGSMLQQVLPFTITLQKLTSLHYPTGQIKNFVSDLIIRLHNGQIIAKQISVNHPLTIDRITIHQASFSDKTSPLSIHVVSLIPHNTLPTTPIPTVIGSPVVLPTYTLHITDFHATSLRPDRSPHATPLSQMDVGPRFSYRWSNDPFEYENFIQPILIDRDFWFLFGVRAAQESSFRYWFVPADAQKSLRTFLAMEQILLDHRSVEKLSHALLLHLQAHNASIPPAVLKALCTQLLTSFAEHGLDRIGSSITTVPSLTAHKKKEMLSVFISLLQGLLYEAWTMVDHKKPARTAQNARFLSHAFLAIEKMHHYPARQLVVVDRYHVIQSSIVQVSSSQGRPFVYAGSGMLVVGLLLLMGTRQHTWSIVVRDQKTILSAYFHPHQHTDVATFDTVVQQLIRECTP